MKIAICLFGYTGNSDKKNIQNNLFDPEISFNNYKEKIFQGHDVDTFIHTWNSVHTEKIKQIYKPKKMITEDQPIFDYSLDNYKLSYVSDYFGIIKNHENPEASLKDLISRTHSRWMSTCKSINLLQEYSIQNNVNYDFVVQLRFDLYFYNVLNFNSLDKNIFYHPVRNHEKNIAINDHFFISNQKNALIFSNIYKNLFNLSIRPVCAAKYFLEQNKINHSSYFEVGSDFQLLRDVNFDQYQNISLIKKIFKKIRTIFI